LLSRMSPVIRRCARTGRVRIDPRELAEMIREGLLMIELDLSVRFARRSLSTHSQSSQRIPLAIRRANNET
jgi:hypothetical protein